jgi:hypothetical protein
VLFLPVPAIAATVLAVLSGGLTWMAAGGLWLLWACAAWGTERDYRRVLAAEMARAQAPPRHAPRALPRRELWTVADREALAEIGVRLPDVPETPERRAP